MSEHLISVFGLFVVVIGIISGIAIKIYLTNKNENKQTHIEKGSRDTEIDYLKERQKQFEKYMETFEEDLQKNHIENDGAQKQMSDMSERIARVEERTRK